MAVNIQLRSIDDRNTKWTVGPDCGEVDSMRMYATAPIPADTPYPTGLLQWAERTISTITDLHVTGWVGAVPTLVKETHKVGIETARGILTYTCNRRDANAMVQDLHEPDGIITHMVDGVEQYIPVRSVIRVTRKITQTPIDNLAATS